MSFDYFYGQQSDLFTFYRVPKVLFTNERFWNISADAKMLYGILLDRMSLSAKNGWIDKNGRVYIIFTIDEAKMALNCAEQKAIKLLSELEKKAGLIERKRQGLGKPNLIYVKNFISAVDSQLLNCENHNSGTMEITTQELPKSQCNNTDIKNTEFSDTDSIFPSGNGGMMDENDRYQEYFDYFSDQLSMDLLKKDYPYDSEMLDNILELIVETVCTKRPLIRIGAEERPAEIVRSRFMKLNAEHIRYVMDCFKGKNAKKYRHNVEYGSARWGTAKDIEPFIAPKFEDNVILTKTERLMMSNRPKNPANARNKNVLIIGGSGSGKTRFWLKPNLLQMHSSYVVTDPKGSIVIECGNALLKHGYTIKIFNTINFQKSMHYNPFAYIHSEKDILKLVTTLIANTKGDGKAGDEFWTKAETLLYCALIGYIHYEAPVEEQNFSTLIEFLNAMEVREDDEEFQNPVDLMFEALEKKKPNHFAVRQYKKYKLAAGDICSK